MTARKKNHYIKSLFENHEEMMKLLNFQVLCERWTTSKPPVLRDKMGNRLTSCAMEAKKCHTDLADSVATEMLWEVR